MWELKASYEKKGLDNRCPMSQSEEGTTEHVLECNKGNKKKSVWMMREEKNRGEIIEEQGKQINR